MRSRNQAAIDAPSFRERRHQRVNLPGQFRVLLKQLLVLVADCRDVRERSVHDLGLRVR
jgi:hypothetical protein